MVERSDELIPNLNAGRMVHVRSQGFLVGEAGEKRVRHTLCIGRSHGAWDKKRKGSVSRMVLVATSTFLALLDAEST